MYKFLGVVLIVLNACQSTNMEQKVIPIFDKYLDIYNQEDTSKFGDDNYIKKEETLMNYRFEKYTKALTIFSNSYCTKPNKKALDKFIEVLIATKDSVYEPRTNILGKVYACHPQPIIDAINNLNKREKADIIHDLESGLQNEIYEQSGKIKNYKQLYNQLTNLKLSL